MVLCRSKHHCRRAAAAAELALLLPVICFLFVLTVDVCRLFYSYLTITNCARNGALYACDTYSASQSPYTSYQLAALADSKTASGNSLFSPALTTSNISSQSGTDANGDNYVAVTVTYTFQPLVVFTGFRGESLPSTAGSGTNGSWPLSSTVRMKVIPTVPSF